MLEASFLIVATMVLLEDRVLTTASGESLPGQLITMDQDGLQWQSNQGTSRFKFEELEQIQFVEPSTIEVPLDRPIVQLVDGSRLRPTSVLLKDDLLAAKGDQLGFELARRHVELLRFPVAEDGDDLAVQWSTLQQDAAEGDVVMLRKTEEAADGTSTTNLVPYEGVVLGIDEDNVQFRFGETVVPVARSRVYAIHLYQAARLDLSEPACRLSLIDGSQLLVRQIRLAEQQFDVTTPVGVNAQLDARLVASIDFTFGRVVYLDQMEPSVYEWTPFIESQQTDPLLAKLNRFRKNESFGGGPITLLRSPSWVDQDQGVTDTNVETGQLQVFDHGLAVRSQSRFIFPLEGRYSRFAALAGIDPDVRPRGHVELIVTGDGQELLRENISGEDLQPLMIDVPVRNVQRLGIEVRFGEGLDVSDFLNLGRARVIK